MANSAQSNTRFRDDDLMMFTSDELVARYDNGLSLPYQQAKDPERIIRFSQPAMQEAAE